MTLRKDLTIIRGLPTKRNWVQERFLQAIKDNTVPVFDGKFFAMAFYDVSIIPSNWWQYYIEPVHCDWNFADDEI